MVSENRKEKKKKHNQKSTTDLYKAWPCCPDVLFLQLGLITGPRCQQPISFRCDSDLPTVSGACQNPQASRVTWEMHSYRESPCYGQEAHLQEGQNRDLPSGSLSFRSTAKITWFKFSPCLRSVTILSREVWYFWSLAPGHTWLNLKQWSWYAEVAESTNEPVLLNSRKSIAHLFILFLFSRGVSKMNFL